MMSGGLCISSVQATTLLSGPIYNPATTHSYFLLTSSDWTDAEAAAVSMGGHLVTVNDAAENDWLLSTFSNFGGQPRALWIGLNDAAEEGAFTWSSGEPVSYTHWEVGQPDDGGGFYPHEDYVLIWPSPGPRSPGYWNDYININTFTQFSLQTFGVVEITTPNNWTNPVSAKWESPSWSLGRLPASNQVVNIVNDGYKAVNIDSATVSGFASSLTVGSLEVGGPTTALNTLLLNYFGLNTPLKVLNSCVIQTNGRLLNLSSSFEVDGANAGRLTIDGGTFTQEGGLTVVTPPVQVQNGTLNATNAAMNLGPLQLGNSPLLQNGTVYQSGGTMLSTVVNIDRGSYSLGGNGTLYALNGTALRYPQADFTQWSGSNYGDIFMSGGTYHMNGGLMHGNNLSTEAGSGFYHTNGVVEYLEVEIGGATANSPDGSSYLLQGGALHSGSLRITADGQFTLQSGTCVVTNGFYLQGDTISPQPQYFATFYMSGGSLFTPSIVVSNFSQFQQWGGTNQVAGDVSLCGGNPLSGGNLWLEAGRMSSVNLGVGQSSFLGQDGGTNEVNGVLSITGQYNLTGGRLSVNGIYLRGTFNIYNQPVLINNGLINFGGRLAVSVSQSSIGPLALRTNGSIGLAGGVSLRFADSSATSWNTNSTLVIESWGWGGPEHIYFGNSGSGLTARQLAQVRFFTPHWLPEGYYPARILSTGEIVPAPILQTSRSGHDFILWWSDGYQLLTATKVLGPYQPISGATSPYTFDMRTAPQRFFILQSQ